jgi:hypothetical protein
VLVAGTNVRADAISMLDGLSPVIFPGGAGLAVMIHGSSATDAKPHPLLELIFRSAGTDEPSLVHFYEHAALHHAIKNEVLGHADLLYRKRPGA